jgi:hypothetical protein
MRLGFKALLLMLGFVLLCVPAALAKNGNGHGHGKPSWAGQGKGHEKAAKPAKAAHEKKAKPEKAAHEKKAKKEKKHQQAGPEAESEGEAAELNLEDLNPSWYCKTLEAMMDEADAEGADGGAEPGVFSSFDAEFGTNDSKRNSHGQCVSQRAHGEDLSGVLDGESADFAGEDKDEDEGEEGDDQAEEDGENEDRELAAFARALVSFIRL